ncbi:quinone oxidoreductase PIG3 [Turdus rufiventris]|nr:quinone oxidoreductase PIG3 [Turdus rufiventris]
MGSEPSSPKSLLQGQAEKQIPVPARGMIWVLAEIMDSETCFPHLESVAPKRKNALFLYRVQGRAAGIGGAGSDSAPGASLALCRAQTARPSSLEKEKMFAAYFDCPGGPENLCMKEVMKPSPGEGEVLVKVSASALNRADLLQRRGKYPPPKGASDILGLEAAGRVAGLGPGCSGRWKIGDAVMALLSGGGQAQFVTVPEGLLMPIPKDMTFIQAAAIPEAWLTAFQLLHFVGKVQEGERVLIHAGASGVGMAAIQLVRLAKAIPIVTAGTQEKLEATANAGAAAGFNYKNEDFSEKVLEFTQGASPRLQPLVDSVYPLHAIAEAHRAMEENRNIGKIVIEIPVCFKKGPLH